jgi:phosphoribosyl 1,2-cyclic phosphate phosphodiesterase
LTCLARVTFLGTGTSHGVPMIGCDCATCRSTDPRDRRWRPSILITLADDTSVLVDASPDLRQQALSFGVRRVDAILFTHAHADHVLGLDEVRRYNVLQGKAIPCYGDDHTIAEVRRTFAYVFDAPQVGGGVPRVNLFPIAGPFCLAHTEIVPVRLGHGVQTVLGYRIGRFAYLTDCNAIPDDSWPLLEGVDTLVVDALRERPHPTHFTVAEALEVVSRLRPGRAYLTHICHDLSHGPVNARLPSGVQLAYDGLEVDIET